MTLWPPRCWADSGAVPQPDRPAPECQAIASPASRLGLCERHDREMVGREAVPVSTGVLR